MTIHIEIPKSELLYRQEDAIRYDGINLRFYNPDYCLEKDNAVRNVFVCFRKKENREEEADITFNGTDPTLRGTLPANGIKVHSERNGNLYRVDITIPWSVQGFIPAVCSHIGFECTLSLYNDGKHELAYWSNGTVPHYNPANSANFPYTSLTRKQARLRAYANGKTVQNKRPKGRYTNRQRRPKRRHENRLRSTAESAPSPVRAPAWSRAGRPNEACPSTASAHRIYGYARPRDGRCSQNAAEHRRKNVPHALRH